jgi:hypothetical protein
MISGVMNITELETSPENSAVAIIILRKFAEECVQC